MRGQGRCSNLVKKMLTQFFQGQIARKFVGETRPFREILVQRRGTGQVGVENVDRGPQKFCFVKFF